MAVVILTPSFLRIALALLFILIQRWILFDFSVNTIGYTRKKSIHPLAHCELKFSHRAELLLML